MNTKTESSRTHFGINLEELMIFCGAKNTLIAKELNYDTSYISKWITGKSLPSKKNIEKILHSISSVLINYANDSVKESLLERFNARSISDLEDAICAFLRNSYYDTLGEMNEYIYINNAALNVTPQGTFPLLNDYARTLTDKSNLNISVMADLFSMDPVSKLLLAGIKNQRFALSAPRFDLKLDYIVDIESLNGSSVYDILLLIHMTTCFSLTDFELYHHPTARGKLLIAVDDEFSGITLLSENMQFLCTTSTRDSKTAQRLYQNLQNLTDPDKKIFIKTDMENLLLSHQYIQALLSQNTRWLIGHMSEQFISPELFSKLSQEYFQGEALAEAKRAYYLASNSIQTNQIQIMVYGLGLMHFAISGELDFFNHKVILSPEELHHELNYLLKLSRQLDANHLRMINEGFSDDFNYITNPYMCLSSSIGYLRLENKQYSNNILLIRDEYMWKTFDDFFDTIWNYSSDIVISDQDIIAQRLATLINAATLFTNSDLR